MNRTDRVRPLRVAMVGLRAPGAEGGVESVVAELGPRLVARGCDVTVLCRGRYNPYGHAFRGMTLVDVPTVYTKHLEAFVHTGMSMRTALSGRFDVLHVHAVGNALWSFAPRFAGLPTVVTVHALDWRRDKWGPLARTALRLGARAAARADAVIAVSAETEAWFAGRAHRVPNGVSALPHADLAEADVPGLQPGYVLSLGRIVPEKRLDVLIRAFAAARHPGPLVITGSHGHAPDTLAALRRLAEARAPGRVLFTGPRHDRAKAALFHHADKVAFPSRVEGLPIAVLEAMSCARTVLASDIPAHRELLAPRAGVLLPADDEGAWTAAIDAPTDPALGALAARRVADHHDWEPITDRTLAIYESVL